MPWSRRITWGSLMLLLAASPAAPQSAAPRESAQPSVADIIQPAPASVRIPRVTRAPKIEDFLEGGTPVGVRINRFLQHQPGDGVPATQETSAFLSFDDKHFYVAFLCKDDPGKVRARMAKREDFVGDDEVGVLLDTFHDRRRNYFFSTNPLGIQFDAISTEGQTQDSSFDTLWRSEGRLTHDGYVVWMAIPFKSLRFSAADVQTWGIALVRRIRRNDELSYWPYITGRKEGFANQFASLEGLENISPGRNMQFIPYGLFTHSRFLDRAASGGPDFRRKDEGRGGLDAKIVLHDAVTMDIAVNPDFSQVESDEPQVTINQRFEVFFPEKRPFFIENAGFFRTPVNLFFSRRVADPQIGLRLTTKAGPWTLAAFGMDDRQATSAFVPSGAGPGLAAECNPLDDGRAAIGVFRVQREFAAQSSVGVYFSSRDLPSCSNRVVSLDTRIKINSNWVFSGQIYRSFTRRQDGSHRSGPGAFAEILHRGRHFTYTGRLQDRSPDLRAHLGFVSRVDIRLTEQFLGYYWRPKRGLVQYVGPTALAVVSGNRKGDIQDWIVDSSFDLGLRGQTYFSVRRNEAFELFSGRGFRKHSTTASVATEWLKWLAFSAQVQAGTSVNFFPGSSLPSFLAASRTARAGFTLRPMPRFRFDQTYIYSRLATRQGSTPAGFSPGTPIFNNHILRSKVNYQFTRELSLRAILDYSAVLPNPLLVTNSRAKSFKTDFLLTYLIHPGTALYVGYSDLYENLEVDPVTMAPLRTLRRTRAPSSPTGRQFFVKLSYLFRF